MIRDEELLKEIKKIIAKMKGASSMQKYLIAMAIGSVTSVILGNGLFGFPITIVILLWLKP